jgi:hypothetical protein
MSSANFPPNSRYLGVATTVFVTPDGVAIAHLERRFLPDPSVFVVAGLHTVEQGDRLDNIAAQSFGDPELFWRICDANGAVRPEELTAVIGRVLKITLPAGIVGPVGA